MYEFQIAYFIIPTPSLFTFSPLPFPLSSLPIRHEHCSVTQKSVESSAVTAAVLPPLSLLHNHNNVYQLLKLNAQ